MTNSYLSQEISKEESNSGRASLSGKRVLVELVVVGSPSGYSTSSDQRFVTEKSTGSRRSLVSKSRNKSRAGGLVGEGSTLRDSESLGGKGGYGKEDADELHDINIFLYG